ncbi:MAG: MFS transporter [Planctomycetota bacterium]
MKWPPPFGKLANPREVWAWGMFDLANQSFTLLINTLLFSVFFKAYLFDGRAGANTMWSSLVACSMLLVVVTGPVVGVWADRRARKKRAMLVSAAVCVACTGALALLPSADRVGVAAALAIAAAVYVPANFAFNIGENLLASFLPEIATRTTIGRVSAIGWTMGYVGALALLVITALAMLTLDIGATPAWRPLFVFAAVWFAVMAVPTALFLPERATPSTRERAGNPVVDALRSTRKAVASAWGFRDLRALLLAFIVYAFGVQTIIFFASIIVSEDFGFTTTKLVLYVLQLTVTAGVGAVAAGAVQDSVGHVNTILAYLAVWMLTTAGLAAVAHMRACAPDPLAFPEWPVWLIGNGVGLGIGGIGTATRACVGLFTPCHRSAEFFALWGFAYKLAGATGPLIFGVVRDVAGNVASLVALACFFVVGAAMLTPVRQTRGVARAEEAEREAGVSGPGDPAGVPSQIAPDHP